MWKGVTEENLISPSKFVKDATQAKSNKTLEKKLHPHPLVIMIKKRDKNKGLNLFTNILSAPYEKQ